MKDTLEKIKKEFCDNLAKLDEVPLLNNLKTTYLGKKGKISELMKAMASVDAEKRKEYGEVLNNVKNHIENAFIEKLKELQDKELEKKLKDQKEDLSVKYSTFSSVNLGAGYHPVTIVQREIEDIFLSMGFDILDGPHVETDYYNFEALNIPKNHPARDMQDTFWFSDMNHLLRTQTSAVQVRGMEVKKPPFKFIVPGKVFRFERTDASHEMAFHQLEGMMVGKDISVANLIYFMKIILTKIFQTNVDVRLRPGFFPFVEPGFELDIKCLICGGEGCSVCKQSGWVELLPCGMVHPNVLKYGNIDPNEYTGFAFGMGLDRLVMMRYMIDDIRLIHSGDLRFSECFKAW